MKQNSVSGGLVLRTSLSDSHSAKRMQWGPVLHMYMVIQMTGGVSRKVIYGSEMRLSSDDLRIPSDCVPSRSGST